jgi:hypothetical protein
MMWIDFQLAAETVERELGLSWGAAQKALLDACKQNEMRSQDRIWDGDGNPARGPSVLDVDFQRWLTTKQTKQTGGKVARVKVYLAEMYPEAVPDPKLCPRKDLQRRLIEKDKSLAPLDEATLKTAIDEYNASSARE